MAERKICIVDNQEIQVGLFTRNTFFFFFFFAESDDEYKRNDTE